MAMKSRTNTWVAEDRMASCSHCSSVQLSSVPVHPPGEVFCIHVRHASVKLQSVAVIVVIPGLKSWLWSR